MRSDSVVDLFCGGGGFSQGFAEAGYEIVAGVDIDDDALATFAQNHDAKPIKADLYDANPYHVTHENEIRASDIDVVIGGPPCQGFSVAGKNTEDDDRNDHLDPLREKIQDDVYDNDEYRRGDAKIDGEVAKTVRTTLDISRREAAIKGIWYYLTILEFPEFVRYRWQGDDLRGKFLDGGEDIYSNALHRLWWIAEITREGDDFTRTEEIFQMQELANDVADRWFARYKPITWACVDELNPSTVSELEPQSSKIISNATTRLNENLTVVLAEGLTYDEAVDLVKEARSDAVEELS